MTWLEDWRELLTAMIVAVMALLGSCAKNPVTGERELALISEKQEIAMGAQASQQIKASLGLVEDESLQEYVNNIGLELARDSERPELPWEFSVVDDPVPNAFALPGGYIFITRGLLSLMDSEAELAAVLGHEIGHVTARHSVNQMSRAQLAQLGLGVGMILAPDLRGLGDLAGSGLQLLFLKYGRDDERQADKLGFRYMLAGGYDVREMDDVFAALQAASEGAGASDIPSWLATHPSPPERIEAVEKRVASLGQLPKNAVLNAGRFMGEIEGLVYGEDPRKGYFENGVFYHPELAFKFAVPEAWQKQNRPSAVVAASPNGDAALQLTMAGSTPREAVTQFLQPDTIREVGTQQTEVHGQNALVTQFQAQSQSGVVTGYATHVAHGEHTYRLVTYAPQQAFQAQQNFLWQLATSFGPVTDPKILNAKPKQLQIIEIDRAMTLAQFNERYPASIPIEELAVINQVTGASSQLEKGALIKRVK